MEKQKLKERKSKTQKGITLVALIITIIVLLILAIVTIRAVQGDGIIQHAKNASKETTVAQEKEQIQLAVNEWKIQKNYQKNLEVTFKSFMAEKISNVDSVDGPDAGPLTVTMKGTENKYTLKEDGTLLIGECWINNGDGTLTKGSETVKIGEKTYSNAEFQEKLNDKGKTYTGSYTGDWLVIGAEGDKLKLVSTESVTTQPYYLGYDDQKAKENVSVADENNITNAEKLKRAAWSYAHAVDTLDEIAQTATKIESARSITIDDIYDIIGEENVDKSSNADYGKTYKYYCDDTTNGQVYSTSKKNADGSWKTGSKAYYQPFTYTNSKKETVTIGTLADGTTINKGEVELTNNYFNYTLTDPQKSAIGRLKTGYYWLASPCVNCYSTYAKFIVRRMSSGSFNDAYLFSSYGTTNRNSTGVLAVVSI